MFKFELEVSVFFRVEYENPCVGDLKLYMQYKKLASVGINAPSL